jgi:hypothetical protein
MKSRRIFLIAMLLLPLSACGLIAIGYNYAEAYLRYSINSYTSFNDEQKVAINKEVNIYMAWHRKNMLAEYVSFLQELQQVAQSDALLTQHDANRFRSEVRALYVKTLQPTIRPAARILSGVDPVQVEELVKSFAKENNKQKDKELSGSQDEQLRKRAERTIDFVENLVGNLRDEQLEKIRELNRHLPFATGIYMSQKEANQARLIELLKHNQGEDEIAAFLSSWLLTPEATRTPDERSMMLAFENASDDMIVSLYQMLTERQKKTLLKNILKYIDIFQELASKT